MQPLASLEQFEVWLREWQAVLSISDWQIRVKLVPGKKLNGGQHTAECWSNAKHRCAEILISRDEEPEEFLLPDTHDWEETLVHELLHCVLDPSLSKSPQGHHQEICYEQGINAIASALIRVKRRGNSGPRTG